MHDCIHITIKLQADFSRVLMLQSKKCWNMHIIHNQVMKHLDRHSILSNRQHGFRKRRSCETQLVLTIEDLVSWMKADRLMLCCLTSEKLSTWSCISDFFWNWTIMESEEMWRPGQKFSWKPDPRSTHKWPLIITSPSDIGSATGVSSWSSLISTVYKWSAWKSTVNPPDFLQTTTHCT